MLRLGVSSPGSRSSGSSQDFPHCVPPEFQRQVHKQRAVHGHGNSSLIHVIL